jgi:hypothetical protein
VDQPTSPLDEALALLAPLEPVQLVRVLSAFLDRQNAPMLKAMRTKAIYELTRPQGETYVSVAARLGVSKGAVSKAVEQHLRDTQADASPMDTAD